MLRLSCILIVCLAGAPGVVRAQDPDRQKVELLNRLMQEFRDLEARGFAPRREDQVRILKRIAQVDHHMAVRFLIRLGQDSDYVSLRGDIIAILADVSWYKTVIAGFMREHMDATNPHRRAARDYLLKLATDEKERNEEWLLSLFSMGTEEDKFLALQGMGRIGSRATLDTAWSLARDPAWKPVPATVITCGTIAKSVQGLEGSRAARLLLLLERDPRFTIEDAAALREATRLWRQSDLRRYVDLAELSAKDTLARIDTATFLGLAGIEAARAPLLHLARDRAELPEVRAAAAEGLGGLTIARGHLASQLAALLGDREPVVRRGAIRGLVRLRVRQAAEALTLLLDGPLAGDARTALAALSGLPEGTDWRDWIRSPRCTLPDGT